nr:transposase [Nonomuraea sediminis]
MSLRSTDPDQIPAATLAVARAAFPKGSLAIRIQDALGVLFHDETFAAAFSTRGRPALSPARLALVSILQFGEGLSDRQAAEAVQGFGLRRSRYRGTAKTHLQHLLIAAAMNLTRLDAWLTGTRLAPTRTSHFAALRPAA